MKKILFFLILSFASMQNVFAQSVTMDNGAVWTCDQYFEARPVRYAKLYQFYDEWINQSNRPAYMNQYDVQYKNASYL